MPSRLLPDSLLPPTNGAAGLPGPGVPAGGTAGQVLMKTSSSNLDTGWVSLDTSVRVALSPVVVTIEDNFELLFLPNGDIVTA